MNENNMEIAKIFEDLVGPDNVTFEPQFSIDGLQPLLLVKPDTTQQVARCLSVCAKLEKAVVPAGLMTWLDGGNPLRRADVVLSLERMNRIIDYSPPDLTLTVEAGLTLSGLNSRTMQERQWLPFDPPGSSRASVGAIAACASSGTLRAGFGTPRDYVIGLRLAHSDGAESKSGGRVVKNVAGYDMNKLYVGSFGTLAVLTELTFKLRPLPERSATLMVTSENEKLLVECARKLLASPLQPVSVFIAESAPQVILRSYNSNRALFIRFAESDAAVRHQLEETEKLIDESCVTTLLNEQEAETVWAELTNLDRLARNAVRLSVPLSAVAETFDTALSDWRECVAAADFGAGIIRLAFDAEDEDAIEFIKRLRADVAGRGGTLFIERASTEVRRRTDVWGEVGPAEGIMKTLKARFDPESLLNPGRFVSGI